MLPGLTNTATPTTTRADDAARLRMVIVRLARWAARTGAATDLTSTQTMVLATVIVKGPLGPSELARVERLNPTMLSRVLRRLEEGGLIRRLSDPTDGRAVLVEATDAGRALHERIRAARSEELSAVLADLESDERAALLDALPVLETVIEKLKERR